jgi:hypothetical protein
MKTDEFARKHNKPCLHLHWCERDAAKTLKTFPEDDSVQTFNVASPRAGKELKVAQFAVETLGRVFNV